MILVSVRTLTRINIIKSGRAENIVDGQFVKQIMLIPSQKLLTTVTTSFATLLAIGHLGKVDTPIRSAVISKSIRSHSTSESSEEHHPVMSEQLKRAKEGALWGMMIADAMSMPVHWFYNPADIKRTYGGWLTGYTAPSQTHPSSILTLSSVDGSGRTGWHDKSKPVVGNIILHNKLKFWQSKDRSTHYHQGMRAGDNTLNSQVALQILKTMKTNDPQCKMPDREMRGLVLRDYVQFMTTPGSHNDTYAESFHRSFFKDWSEQDKRMTTAEELLEFTEKRYFERSKGPQDSQLVVIGALSIAIPWILRNAHKSENDCAKSTVDFIKCTHPVTSLVPFIDLYSRLLHGVLNGRDLKQEVTRVLAHSELGGPGKRELVLRLLEKVDNVSDVNDKLRVFQAGTQTLGSACYIEGSLSSMLFLAYAFSEGSSMLEAGVLTNANCGGENCHRGAALGALLGAQTVNAGNPISQKLIKGLVARDRVASVL